MKSDSSKKKIDVSKTILSYFRSDSTRSTGHKIKSSLFAILIGFIIGSIPIIMAGGDVFSTYVNMFTAPFSSMAIKNSLTMIAIFILLGAGIGISFKTGLFNIGAAGQFLFAGGITTVMGIQMHISKGASIPLMLVVSALIGGAAAAVAGILKAFFNVHEVVSTILLNWILFYFVKFLFNSDALRSTSSAASKPINSSMQFSLADGHNDIYIILFITLVIVGIIFVIFKYTTFGYQMKINGLNKDAAKYAGINTKLTTIYSMTLSGALCGVAGFIYYSTVEKQIPDLKDSLPTLGFEAITVTLLAFSSPAGAILAGAFYGSMKAGAVAAASAGNVPKETIDLVLGLIIFFAALAPVMTELKPIEMTKKYILSHKIDSIKLARTQLNKELRAKNSAFRTKVNDAKQKDLADAKIWKTLLLEEKTDDELLKIYMKANLNKQTIKLIHKIWASKVQVLNLKQKEKRMSIIDRDIEIKKINAYYKNLIDENHLNDLENEKVIYKSFVREQKNIFRIKINEEISLYKKRSSVVSKVKGGR